MNKADLPKTPMNEQGLANPATPSLGGKGLMDPPKPPEIPMTQVSGTALETHGMLDEKKRTRLNLYNATAEELEKKLAEADRIKAEIQNIKHLKGLEETRLFRVQALVHGLSQNRLRFEPGDVFEVSGYENLSEKVGKVIAEYNKDTQRFEPVPKDFKYPVKKKTPKKFRVPQPEIAMSEDLEEYFKRIVAKKE